MPRICRTAACLSTTSATPAATAAAAPAAFAMRFNRQEEEMTATAAVLLGDPKKKKLRNVNRVTLSLCYRLMSRYMTMATESTEYGTVVRNRRIVSERGRRVCRRLLLEKKKKN